MDAKTLASLPPKLLAQYLRDPQLQAAMQMQQEGSDTSPVGHWTQGLARMLKSGVGAYQQGALREKYGKQAQDVSNERQAAMLMASGRPAETQQIGGQTINWQPQQPNLMSAARMLSAPDNQDLANSLIGQQFNQQQMAQQQAFAQQQQERQFQQQQAMQNAMLERQMAFERYKLENDPMKQLVQQYLGQSGQGAPTQPQGAIPNPPSPGQAPQGIQLDMTRQQAFEQPSQQNNAPTMQDAMFNAALSKQMGNPPEGMMWGRGGLIPAPNPKITDEQAKAAGYYQRMQNSNQVMGNPNVTSAVMDWKQQAKSAVPLVGNSLVSENFQAGEQAQRDFINALLRRESGAVIAPSEFENAQKQYFPQYGDGAAVLAQKAKNREIAMQGILGASGGARYNIPQQPMQQAPQPQQGGFDIDSYLKQRGLQ